MSNTISNLIALQIEEIKSNFTKKDYLKCYLIDKAIEIDEEFLNQVEIMKENFSSSMNLSIQNNITLEEFYKLYNFFCVSRIDNISLMISNWIIENIEVIDREYDVSENFVNSSTINKSNKYFSAMSNSSDIVSRLILNEASSLDDYISKKDLEEISDTSSPMNGLSLFETLINDNNCEDLMFIYAISEKVASILSNTNTNGGEEDGE